MASALIISPSFKITFGAVSYTHLDVYKRQRQYQLSYDKKIGLIMHLSGVICSLVDNVPIPKKYNYKNIDVYKRQALTLYNTFTFELNEGGLNITGCPTQFCNEENLTYRAFSHVVLHVFRQYRSW